MATKPLVSNPVADLPENWVNSEIVAPSGQSVGLTQQHGYNYLMSKVNEALTALGTVNDAFTPLLDTSDEGSLKTVTGSIASFSDGSGMPLKSFQAAINPVQNLNGQSAPYPAGGGKNKFNRATVTEGSYVAADGSIGSSSSFALSDYIPVSGANITISGNSNWGTSPSVCFYDSGKTYISGEHPTTDPVTLTVPSGAAYIRSSLASSSKSTFQVELGSTATDYAPYSNICPIYGWTGVNAYRAGVNFFNMAVTSTLSNNGVTFTPLTNGRFKLSGTATAETVLVWDFGKAGGGSGGTNPSEFLLPNGEYKIYGLEDKPQINIQVRGGNGSDNTGLGFFNKNSTTLTINSTTKYRLVRLNIPNGTVFGDTGVEYGLTIAKSADTVSDYTPYAGTTYPVSWADTAGDVYVGYVDLVSGKLVATHIRKTISEMEWIRNDQNNYFASGSAASFVKAKTDVMSEMYKTVTWDMTVADQPDMSIKLGKSDSSQKSVYIKDTVNTNASTWKSTYGSIALLFELETPAEYTLDPVTITSLLGQNSCWSDCNGDTTVQYESAGLASVELLAEVLSELAAEIEEVKNTKEIFLAVQNTTTADEISDALAAGKTVLLKTTSNLYGQYVYTSGSGVHYFAVLNTTTSPFSIQNVQVNGSTWALNTQNTGPLERTVTLAAADWSSFQQTVSVTGLDSSYPVVVAPDPTDAEDYIDAGIICTAQGSGTLTFKCTSTPVNDIGVNVLIFR